jgi:hypothetical protein
MSIIFSPDAASNLLVIKAEQIVQKIASSPIGKIIRFNEVPYATTGGEYTRFDFGANGNQKATEMPVISAGQNILTAVNASMASAKSKFITSGHAIEFTHQEMRIAEKLGYDTFDKKFLAMQEKYEQYITEFYTAGNTVAGAYGLFSNDEVTKSGLASAENWTMSTENKKILADIRELKDSIFQATGGTAIPDTLMMGLSNYSILSQKSASSGLNEGVTLLDIVKAEFPNVVPTLDYRTVNRAGKQRLVALCANTGFFTADVSSLSTDGCAPTQNGTLWSQPYFFGFGEVQLNSLKHIQYRDFT